MARLIWKPLLDVKLSNEVDERIRRNLVEAILELRTRYEEVYAAIHTLNASEIQES